MIMFNGWNMFLGSLLFAGLIVGLVGGEMPESYFIRSSQSYWTNEVETYLAVGEVLQGRYAKYDHLEKNGRLKKTRSSLGGMLSVEKHEAEYREVQKLRNHLHTKQKIDEWHSAAAGSSRFKCEGLQNYYDYYMPRLVEYCVKCCLPAVQQVITDALKGINGDLKHKVLVFATNGESTSDEIAEEEVTKGLVKYLEPQGVQLREYRSDKLTRGCKKVLSELEYNLNELEKGSIGKFEEESTGVFRSWNKAVKACRVYVASSKAGNEIDSGV